MSRTALSLSASLFALSLAAPAFAQTQEGGDTDVEVIHVTSSPLAITSDEVVGSVEIVDAEHIEDRLAGTLADTIAHEPGVNSTYFGPASSRPVIRGLGADRVRILNNGVGLIDASGNSPDHATATEALEAERIEILRGPAAIAYGGGAIGGVVNVLDGRIPEAAPVDGLVDGRIYLGASSVDDGRTAAGHARFGAGPFVFHLDLLSRDASDYEIPGFAESARLRAMEEEEEHGDEEDHEEDHDHEEEEVFGLVENSSFDVETGSIGASYVFDRGFIGAAVKFTDSNYGVPGHSHEHGHEEEHEHDDAAPAIAAAGEEGEEEENVRIGLIQTRFDIRGAYSPVDGLFERFSVSAGGADYKHTEFEGDEIGTVFRNEGYEARFEARLREQGHWAGAFGLQIADQDFKAFGPEAFLPAAVTEDFGVFGVGRYDAGDWGFEFGARAETRDVSSPTVARSFDTQSISGSLFWRPTEAGFLSATLSSTERAPTDIELFSDGPHIATQSFELGDPDLDTESALSVEFAARNEFWNGWAFEGAVFHADYDGFIDAFLTGDEEDELPVVEYRQADATLTGFEAQIEAPLGELFGFQLTGLAQAEFVETELDGGGDLPRTPPFGFSAGIEASSDAYTGRLELDFAGDSHSLAENELETDGYTLINAFWSARPFEEHDLRIILEGRNLGDEEARLHTSYLKDQLPLPGRNFRIGLSYGF